MLRIRKKRRRTGAESTTALIYQLKIALKDIRPPIWRRVLVPGDVSLATLHRIIQAVMGWADYHLHEFAIGDVNYGPPSPSDWYPAKDERKATLSQVAPKEGMKFTYTYDFGDGWEHVITVEKRLPPDPDAHYPVCIAGKRACPPEDCGGVWGYANLLEIIQNPRHEEYEEMMEWLGGEFDPAAFDLEVVNRALKRFSK